jgi:hypothetical protein
MRSMQITNVLKNCCRLLVENDPLIYLRAAEAMITATRGDTHSQQPARAVLKTLGHSRNKVLVHARPSSAELPTTAAFLESHDLCKAQEYRLVCFSVDEAFFGPSAQSVYGYLRSREPVALTISLEENDDIVICSSCSGFIWRPRFRS